MTSIEMPEFGQVWSWAGSGPYMVVALGEDNGDDNRRNITLVQISAPNGPVDLMWYGTGPRASESIRSQWKRLDTEVLV